MLLNIIYLLMILLLFIGFSEKSYAKKITSVPILKINNNLNPIVIWSNLVGNGTGLYYSLLHPTFYENTIFVADRYGIIKALDNNTGKEIWSVDLSIKNNNFSALLSGGLTATNSRIYVGTERAKIYALNSKNGLIKWQTNVSGEVLSSPTVCDGIIFVHTSNGILQALDEFDGTIKWTINLYFSPLTLRRESSPVIDSGIAIVGGDYGRISAVLINKNQIFWQNKIIPALTKKIGMSYLNGSHVTPVVVNKIVYIISYNGNLIALNLYSGKVIWSSNISSIKKFLVNNGSIYLVDQNDKIISCDIKTGITIWSQNSLLNKNLTSPILYNGYIIIGDIKGYLYWINTENGKILLRKKIDRSGLLSQPIVVNNKLIVQTKNGKIYALI